ncbi:MAG: IscS subfamily cysteine desulfurase [Candidatus Methylomirabilales bacterium]
MGVRLPIYMDYHATTPVDAEVLEAMLPYFGERFGNPSSRTHVFGWTAESAVEKAREQLGQLIACKPMEVVFTSGATESNNLALKGVAWASRDRGNHIITTAIEHHAVLDACHRLEKEGFDVTYLPVDRTGLADPLQVEEAITDRTILVSVIAAHNEIGTIQPLAEIGRICRARGVLFHSDAAQALGKIPLRVDEVHADFLSFSAHKLYGPKGVGGLYVRMTRPAVKLIPLQDGGGQERGRRSGTQNVPGIVGFGQACEVASRVMAEEGRRLTTLRERLKEGIVRRIDGVHLNGHPERRLPGNLNLSFARVEGEALLLSMKDVAVSSGSACTSTSMEPSYVLRALGVDDALARSSIRFGLGRWSTEEEVDFTIEKLAERVGRLRAMWSGPPRAKSSGPPGERVHTGSARDAAR